MVTHCKRLLTTPSLGIFSTFPTLKIFKSNDESSFTRVTGFVKYFFAAIAMDNIEVGDGCWKLEMCRRKLQDVGDSFGHLDTKLTSGTNIQNMSPTSKFDDQHPHIVTNLSH